MQFLLPELCSLAHRAGAEVLRVYRAAESTPIAHHTKADQSPLTEADLASHRCICAALRVLTPDIPVVSEEEAPERLPAGTQRFWLVDPLDGTKEFLARTGEFTVNIALVEDGFPALGVVQVPATGAVYWGGLGLGAHRAVDGQTDRIRVTAVTPACRRVLASRSHMDEDTRRFIDRLGPVTLVQAGSSLKFCRVAEGSADLYPRLGPTCEWDTAAAQAVLEGAGGQVLTLDGARLTCGKPGWRNPFFVASAQGLPQPA